MIWHLPMCEKVTWESCKKLKLGSSRGAGGRVGRGAGTAATGTCCTSWAKQEHGNLFSITKKPYLRSWSSKRLRSSQARINMGVLHVNFGVESVCLDGSLLFQNLHHKDFIEAMDGLGHCIFSRVNIQALPVQIFPQLVQIPVRSK